MESMDLVDSDSGGIRLTLADDISSSYSASYLESFVPAYQMVNQSSITGVADRYRAIKFAADASLALTASGASWSDALRKMLADADTSEGNASADHSGNEDQFCSRSSEVTDVSSASAVSTSSREQSPDLDGGDRCERRGPDETVSEWGAELRSHGPIRKGSASRRRAVLQRGAEREARRNWSRNRRLSREAKRLAILRTLSKQNRFVRGASSKPRKSAVRKVKSLAKSRRSLSRYATKPVAECPEQPEQRFENGLVALQRLVPGGSNMTDAAVLLDEAADFVMFLKLQVQALQSVADAVGIDTCTIDS